MGRKISIRSVEIQADPYATRVGYDVMRLDTVASMTIARSVYGYWSLGFEERDPYYHNGLEGKVYMHRTLHGDYPHV